MNSSLIKSQMDVPGQQESRSNSNPSDERDDVGDVQVALYTHHQDQEGNNRLEAETKRDKGSHLETAS